IFLWVKLSEAAVNTATSLQSTANADSKPFMFGVSKLNWIFGSLGKLANSVSLSAICGTHLAETQEPTSIACKPVFIRSRIRFLRSSSVKGVFSFCRPSRGPTSTILTKSVMQLPPLEAETQPVHHRL